MIRSLNKENAKYDTIVGQLASINAAMAYVVKQHHNQLRDATKFRKQLTEQLRTLRSWIDTMSDLQRYLREGDRNIVHDGSPGLTLRGKLKMRRVYQRCEGRLPTFCTIETRKAVLKVKETIFGIEPLRGGTRK